MNWVLGTTLFSLTPTILLSGGALMLRAYLPLVADTVNYGASS